MEVTRLRGTERRARRKEPAPGCLAGELQGGEVSALRSRNLGGPRGRQGPGKGALDLQWPGLWDPSVWGMFGSVGVGGGCVRSEEVRDRGPGGWGVWRGRRTRWSRHLRPGSSDGVQGYGRVRVQSGEVRGPGFG